MWSPPRLPSSRSNGLESPIWPKRHSPLARQGALVVVLIILYASLYPLTGWRDSGLGAFAYLGAPWPRYYTGFDLLTNVIAYLPFGVLMAWTLHPRLRGAWAVLVVVLFGVVLSGGVEALQTYLPNRVASNVDFGMNVIGAGLGAVLGVFSASPLIDRGRLRYVRLRWFEPYESPGLLLVAMWFAANAYPQALLFGLGDLLSPLLTIWNAWIYEGVHPTGASLVLPLLVLTPVERVTAEAIGAGCAFAGGAAFLLHMVRPAAPRWLLLALFLLAAVLSQIGAAVLTFGSAAPLKWATPGGLAGIAGGFAVAALAAFLPRGVLRALALLLISAAAIIVNAVAADPYFVATLAAWRQGQWLNFNELLRLLSIVWPYAAVIYLLKRKRRQAETAQL